MKIPTRTKKWKSSYKGKKNLENLDQFQQANYRKRNVSHWFNKPKRCKSTYMSYWQSQNLNSKISKICSRASVEHSARNYGSRRPLWCNMRTIRTEMYMQDANSQGSRRLLMDTVRESLKLMKILKNQEKSKLTFRPRRSLRVSWGLRDWQIKRKMQTEKMATESSKTKKTKGIIPQWSHQFCYRISPWVRAQTDLPRSTWYLEQNRTE